MPISTITLSNGLVAPSIAFGTGTKWFAGVKGNEKSEEDVNQELVTSIFNALKAGFRHIDTAEVYGTEKEVGLAVTQFLKESGLKRSDLFITTKVYPHIDNITSALDASLERLGPSVEGYVDLYLIHAPFWDKTKETLEGAWKKMEAAVDAKKTKAIGVSNFRIVDFDEVFKFAKIKPVCNQIEYNPYLQDSALKSYSDANGITTAAYAPLGPLTHFSSNGTYQQFYETLQKKGGPIASISQSQLLLLWVLHKRGIAVTTTAKPERLKEFLDIQELVGKVPADVFDALEEATLGLSLRKFWSKEFA
ncbi:hypothetical protein HDU97_001600 [Phlyctochytrium planicorne]|nr:hypothetical protein HDU97_001600 [Phlyctochytrium planicorne]